MKARGALCRVCIFGLGLLAAMGPAWGAPCSGPLPAPFVEPPVGQIGFRMLITRFTGSEPMATELGPSLRDELTRYMRRELGQPAVQAAGLRGEHVQVRYADCEIRLRDYDQARRYGQEVGADVVFFGQALAEDRQKMVRRAQGAVKVDQRVAGNVSVTGRNAALTKVEVKIAGGKAQIVEGWHPVTQVSSDEKWTIQALADRRSLLFKDRDPGVPPFRAMEQYDDTTA